MIEPALQMLIERLAWPVPRVRWEAARQIAGLISAGHPQAVDALLDWASKLTLESEAVTVVSLVDAYQLAAHVPLDRLNKAIRAPSHLTDLLISLNYPAAKPPLPFRYGYATPKPLQDANLSAYFHRQTGSVVPPVFRHALERVGSRLGQDCVARWEYEWLFLQKAMDAPLSDSPRYFVRGVRDEVGQFDVRQRELFVSAYIRTLAYAAAHWGLPHDAASFFALHAAVLNRGLAEILPSPRPQWTIGLLGLADEAPKVVAEGAWSAARGELPANEDLLALRAVDHDENGFVEVTISGVLTPAGNQLPDPAPDLIDDLSVHLLDSPTGMSGRVDFTDHSSARLWDEEVVPAICWVWPHSFGRFHNDVFGAGVELASPHLFMGEVEMACSETCVELHSDGKAVSRCITWNSDWKPSHPKELHALSGQVTTIDSDMLERFCRDNEMQLRRHCRIRRAGRKESYEELAVTSNSFWLEAPRG